eukprot:c14297_g1_i1 orf=145-1575(-)
MVNSESWLSYGTLFGFLALLHTLINNFLPQDLRSPIAAYARRFFSLFSSYLYFGVEEYDGTNVNELFSAVQTHLSEFTATAANCVNIALPKNASSLSYTLAPDERILDIFQGKQMWWEFKSMERKQPSSGWNPVPDEKRSLRLRVHKRDRGMLPIYINHILAHSKEIKQHSRDRLLYTNMKSHSYDSWGGRRRVWAAVPFKHPATFETLAMDDEKKESIIEDLTQFAKGEHFYKKAGRAWKRGYLLYGPPGTGKSSMIAAMANFLQYDVYDLELTEVKSNAQLRNLLIKTSNKSLIVIEDIDCSLNLTDREKKTKTKQKEDPKDDDDNTEDNSQVTLSGLLNFTDGLWSCCGSERIFVFTTNHIEKLDPALLRSGRMDMHIHMSYCSFEAFKVLARNYLDLDEHELFEDVRIALAEEDIEITPADVSEILTKKKRNVEEALRCVVGELHGIKAKRKAALQVCEDEETSRNEENQTL